MVTVDNAEVYQDKKVVRLARKNDRLRFVSRNGQWIGVSWPTEQGEQSGWISESKARVDGQAPAAPSGPDVGIWVSPSEKHPQKPKLRALVHGASAARGQEQVRQAQAAIQLDPANALLFYLAACGAADGSQWADLHESLRQGNARREAYTYVTQTGMDQYLTPLPHLDPIKALAIAVLRKAKRVDPAQGAQLLKSLREMGHHLAAMKPHYTNNLQLSLAIISIADVGLEQISKPPQPPVSPDWLKETKSADQAWIAEAQQEMMIRGGEELAITRHYLRLGGLDGKAVAQFELFAPHQAIQLAAERSRKKPDVKPQPNPTETSSRPEPKSNPSFYRRAGNYDFLSSMLSEIVEDEREKPKEEKVDKDLFQTDESAQAADFFKEQEQQLLKTLKGKEQRDLLDRAREFLVASLSERTPFFERLMQPKNAEDRSDRERWDMACDAGLKETAEFLEKLLDKMPR